MKNSRTTVTLAILVRNERKGSEVIFPQISKKSVDEIFVIDGHSTDGTQNYYKKQKIPVYEQRERGIGAAVLEARGKCKTDAIIFFHPDGNEDPKDIQKIADSLRNGHKFVIPSRMIKGGFNEEDIQLFRPRKWFNKTLALVANIIWKHKKPFVSEIVQGFRGIDCKTFDLLRIDRKDPSIDFHMVIRALKYNIPIYEFPTHEGTRLFGETSFKSFETGVIEFKMLFRELFNPVTYPKKN